MKRIGSSGYAISVVGVAIILVWIGIFKFTNAEAAAIKPYVENSFLMSWMYHIADQQTVSNVIGFVEVLTGLGLLAHFIWKKAGFVSGILSALTFLATLSFIFTTPGSFKTVEGVPVTNFFILKDIMALGISMMVISKSRAGHRR